VDFYPKNKLFCTTYVLQIVCVCVCFFFFFGKINHNKKISSIFQIFRLLIVDLCLFRVRMVTRCTTKCSKKIKFNG
jgi:magnesium-transporting ATPase (P-type)